MKEILTSAAFWTGFTPIALALIAVFTRQPKALMDTLARRQLFQAKPTKKK